METYGFVTPHSLYKEFRGPYCHPSHHGETTLCQLASIAMDPLDVEAYFAACKEFRLNSVFDSFWHNWPLSQPAIFLTPEALHHWFCEFYDHDLGWCLFVIGRAELNFQFSILMPIVGCWHFPRGVSKLKQVTGWVQRDILCYIVAVIAGSAPPRFVSAIHVLVEFWYMAQSPAITEATCEKIVHILGEFHDNKQSIINLRTLQEERQSHEALANSQAGTDAQCHT